MEILIAGELGTGKSNLGDMIKNYIFKVDKNSTIVTDDPSRQIKLLGSGKNIYNIRVSKSFTKDVLNNADIIININSDSFNKWFREIKED